MSKSLFWDFDGTLVYPKPFSNSVCSALRYFGYEVDYNFVRSHLRTGFTWHTPENDYSTITGYKWWEHMFKHFDKLYQFLNISEPTNEINQKVRELVLKSQDYSVYEDTFYALKLCAEVGFDNYILSNNYPELVDVIEGLNLSTYFKAYVVSAQVGYDKPRREIFEIAYKLANCPKICYMVGDNPIADIQGAKLFGISAILVHNKADCDADYFFQSLTDAANFLCRI